MCLSIAIWTRRSQYIPICLSLRRKRIILSSQPMSIIVFKKPDLTKRLFYTQGDYGLFQCSEPCCQETYDNEALIRQMMEQQHDMRVPSELVPRCPHCGKPMTMNLRCDDTFVQDEGWHRAAERYENFLRTRAGCRILFLELGVGYNTPGIIKYPFWRMTAQNPRAVYACINQGEAYAPREIAQQSICMDGDIGETLSRLSGTRQ